MFIFQKHGKSRKGRGKGEGGGGEGGGDSGICQDEQGAVKNCLVLHVGDTAACQSFLDALKQCEGIA